MAEKFIFTTTATVTIFFLLLCLSAAETYLYDNTLFTKLFPNIEITLANDYHSTIYFMCKNTDKDDKLHPLKVGETYRFGFTQVAFPMRWCFIYINSHTHGFLWVYNMRSRCTKCFWSITSFPNLFKTDRVRWERQKLFLPLGFDINQYKIKQGPW